MGVAHEVFEAARKVDRRNRRKLQTGRSGGFQGLDGDRFARLEDVLFRGRDVGIRLPHVDLDLRGGVVAGRGRRDADLPDSGLPARLEPEGDDLFALVAEDDAPALRPDHGERFVHAHPDVGFTDPFFEGEDRDRKFDLLLRGDHAGQGRLHQKRFFHGDLLRRGAEGAAVGRYDHHAHRPEVGRQRDLVGVGLPGAQLLGAEEPHDGFEPLRPERSGVRLLGVAADGEQLLDAAAVGADDMVEQVPRADAQRFGGVEIEVGVGRPETRQPQQSLVDQRQHVAHPPAVPLADPDRDFRLGFHRFGHLDDGRKARAGVLDRKPQNAEQPDRRVVERVAVGLDEGHRDVDVRGHALPDGNLEGGLPVGACYPAAFADEAAALDAHQGPGARGRRDGDLRLVARHVFVLVAGDGQACRGVGHRGDAAPVIGRRHADDARRRMRLSRARHADEVVAGIARAPAHRDLSRAVREGGPQGFVLGVERAFGVAGLGSRRRGVPPPVGTHPVNRHGRLLRARRGTAPGVEQDEPQRMVAFAVEVLLVPVALLGGYADSEIGVVGRDGRDLLVDAEIAALFEDLDGEFAVQHPRTQPFQRGEPVGGQLQRAVGAGRAGDDLPLLGGELLRGVVERIVGVALEARRNLRQLRLERDFRSRGRCAVQPPGRQPAGELLRVDGLSVAEAHLDLHPVGLDGVHADVFLERRAAEGRFRAPDSRGGGGRRP